jgi:two-component system sensor histidine kinase CiaH
MFQSATLKLTGWYLLILMGISLLFSVMIYQVASSEVNTRLSRFQAGIQHVTDLPYSSSFNAGQLRENQAHEAATNLFVGLLYANLLILLAGGIGSYLLARRTLEPIELAHEAQSRFTSDASHELRTPLAVMKTELEVALRDPNLTKGEMRDILESNLEEVDKLTSLSHSLLQLSKLDHTAIDKGPVVLNDIVQGVIDRFDKTGTRIQYHAPPQDLIVEGHEISIEELATILIDNAIKYSPDNSLVSVTVAPRSSKACLEVINTGKGIEPDDLPHIFDRFYRADSSRTGGSKTGYGLGLSLAKKIVEMHDGELSASSARNHKTTFTAKLPLYTKDIDDKKIN